MIEILVESLDLRDVARALGDSEQRFFGLILPDWEMQRAAMLRVLALLNDKDHIVRQRQQSPFVINLPRNGSRLLVWSLTSAYEMLTGYHFDTLIAPERLTRNERLRFQSRVLFSASGAFITYERVA